MEEKSEEWYTFLSGRGRAKTTTEDFEKSRAVISTDVLILVSSKITQPLEKMTFLQVRQLVIEMGIHLPSYTTKTVMVEILKSKLGNLYEFNDKEPEKSILGSCEKDDFEPGYLDGLTIRQLKLIASTMHIYRYSIMSKLELIKSIQKAQERRNQ